MTNSFLEQEDLYCSSLQRKECERKKLRNEWIYLDATIWSIFCYSRFKQNLKYPQFLQIVQTLPSPSALEGITIASQPWGKTKCIWYILNKCINVFNWKLNSSLLCWTRIKSACLIKNRKPFWQIYWSEFSPLSWRNFEKNVCILISILPRRYQKNNFPNCIYLSIRTMAEWRGV